MSILDPTSSHPFGIDSLGPDILKSHLEVAYIQNESMDKRLSTEGCTWPGTRMQTEACDGFDELAPDPLDFGDLGLFRLLERLELRDPFLFGFLPVFFLFLVTTSRTGRSGLSKLSGWTLHEENYIRPRGHTDPVSKICKLSCLSPLVWENLNDQDVARGLPREQWCMKVEAKPRRAWTILSTHVRANCCCPIAQALSTPATNTNPSTNTTPSTATPRTSEASNNAKAMVPAPTAASSDKHNPQP